MPKRWMIPKICQKMLCLAAEAFDRSKRAYPPSREQPAAGLQAALDHQQALTRPSVSQEVPSSLGQSLVVQNSPQQSLIVQNSPQQWLVCPVGSSGADQAWEAYHFSVLPLSRRAGRCYTQPKSPSTDINTPATSLAEETLHTFHFKPFLPGHTLLVGVHMLLGVSGSNKNTMYDNVGATFFLKIEFYVSIKKSFLFTNSFVV